MNCLLRGKRHLGGRFIVQVRNDGIKVVAVEVLGGIRF